MPDRDSQERVDRYLTQRFAAIAAAATATEIPVQKQEQQELALVSQQQKPQRSVPKL
jgi:hypothetical protein